MAQKPRSSSAARSRQSRAAEPPSQPPNPPTPPSSQPLILTGPTEPYPAASILVARRTDPATVDIDVKAEFRPTSRAPGPPQTVDVQDEDLLEIEFANGERIWLRGDDYRRRFAAATSRDAAGTLVTPAPQSLQVLPSGMQSRGPVAWIIKSLKVLGVDLQGKTAQEIARIVEARQHKNGLGLFRCTAETEKFQLQSARLEKQDSPLLLLLHGTASSTWGSFGELWSSERARELATLRAAYPERLFAFEHETFMASPVENALELAKALPAGARLHLVSHSRGGLVGELLCRGAFEQDELQLFDSDGQQETQDRLRELDQVLKEKGFRVERFVRVACPALGTTLASERLDRWLAVIGSVAGKALPATPLGSVLGDLGEFIAAVVKERTDPRTLPGLEAMMPDSPSIRLVNWPRASVTGDLLVIAGDIDPDAWWARLLVWTTDRFYNGDHDLVVNTPSMVGGAKRQGRMLTSFHKGPEVNHFNYFRNADSAQRLVAGLTQTGDLEGFEPLTPPTEDIARAVAASRAVGPRPVVFLLPGIMGSELAVGDDRVWLDIPDLAFGGLQKLRIDAANVRAIGLFNRYYGALANYLAGTHKVVPFPFDWRLAIEQEADRLAEAVRAELEQARRDQQPVRLLAHSLGGLVARTMIARHPDLWRNLCAQPGARLVMLGTPNGGSYAINETLVGQSSTLRQLSFIDFRHTQEQLLAIISRFPGMLAMLPVDNREDYFSRQTWDDYQRRAGKGWRAPDSADLDRARAFRQLLDQAPVEPKVMAYVAGSADVTLCGMYYDRQASANENPIKFLATVRGDGRVTWDSGLLADVPTWYMDVEHGDLAASTEDFPALLDLLQSGTTARLPRTPPVSRAAADTFPRPPQTDVLYPDETTLQAALLGAGPRRRRQPSRRRPKVRVRVLHGDLAFARHPVAVGHYMGDTIINAERALDRALNGELTRRQQLGLYPGGLETAAIFVNTRLRDNPRATPKGAIIVGLGAAGALSVANLTHSFTRALLEYVLKWPGRAQQGGEEAQEFGVSPLLIGAGAGGVGVADAVFGLLQGVVRANEALATAKQPQRITDVEFIEVWEDRAIQAMAAFARIGGNLDLQKAFDFKLELICAKGGRRRAAYDEPPGWWRRIQILGKDEPGQAQGTLRFGAATRRARAEVRLQPTQRKLVDQFVKEAIGTTQDNHAISRTLFELLLPRELKEAAPEQDNIVLALDEEAAHYPWELLEDPGPAPESAQPEPLAIQHGLLRQLELQDFRETVRPSIADNALVVGDPISPFIELKGAQVEAETVARSLQANGKLRVTLLDRPSSDEVIQALYERPYRLLHLAGHGVYQYPLADGGGLVTGMVIGDGVFLTPIEVRQMRQTPELVFINCCHLGRMTAPIAAPAAGAPAAATAATPAGAVAAPITVNDRQEQNLLAASVAAEFIRNGVRVVIAAGWAVDDGAAAVFAQTFYNHMLDGVRFGEAVKLARQAAYQRRPGVNTWGAYQCYGDPDYCLISNGEAVQDRSEQWEFATPAVAATAIGNLAAELGTMADQDIKAQVEALQSVEKHLEEKQWLDHGSISVALAKAYSEALLFDEAKDHYRRALQKDPAAATLKDVEQYANLLSRAAVDVWKSGQATQRNPLDEIEQAIGYLDWLADTPGDGNTVERLSLYGAAYKRKAWIAGDPERIVLAVAVMKKKYQAAGEYSAWKDPYSVLNLLFAELVEGWFDPTVAAANAADIRAKLPTARAEIDARCAQDRDFWAETGYVDSDLLDALLNKKLDAQLLDRLSNRYQEIKKLASRREFASVTDQIEFLIAMAVAAQNDESARALRALLERLDETLADWVR